MLYLIVSTLLLMCASAAAFSWRKVLPRCFETERYKANKKLDGGLVRVEERGQFFSRVIRSPKVE